MWRQLIPIALLAAVGPVAAGEKAETAVGAGVGAAVGAAIGEEIGERKGAIVGGALGGAIGAAIATQDHDSNEHVKVDVESEVIVVEQTHPKAKHCPPGQAKKGRC